MSLINISEVDLRRAGDASDVITLTDAYAQSDFGQGKALSKSTSLWLISGLKRHQKSMIFIAYDNCKPVGIATCFVQFSTFKAKEFINIHDLFVMPELQGKGVGRRLIKTVLNKAIKNDFCKVTLEVQENNKPAKSLYESMGFTGACVNGDDGNILYLAHSLE